MVAVITYITNKKIKHVVDLCQTILGESSLLCLSLWKLGRPSNQTLGKFTKHVKIFMTFMYSQESIPVGNFVIINKF
jgi:hypothetical protein